MPPLHRTGTGPVAEDPEFAGEYRLEARLGSGGMGVVHLARSASGLRLAVKVVHSDFADDDEFRARFRQEVAAARRVSGAFTAPVVDADPEAVRPWMATLYIPGPTLSEHVKWNGPLAPGEVRRLATGLAEALRDIHRAGVVHRDLKPGNVLLAADGPKVIDFGISRPVDSELRTETGKLIGTPPFMAPEQFQRPRSVGPAADVFALGSVLVHAATGRGPFDSESPYLVAYQVVHDEADLTGVPEDLLPLIGGCLAKEPAERPTPDALMAMVRSGAGSRSWAESGPSGDLAAAPRRSSALERVEHIEDVEYIERVEHIEDVERGREIPAGPAQPLPGSAEATHVSRKAAPAQSAVARIASGTRGRSTQWVAVGTVALVVFGAGAAGAVRQFAGPSDPGGTAGTAGTPPRSTAAAFHPWQTELSDADPGPSGASTPFCTYADGALYCAAPGVKAARLDPADGRELWSRAGVSAPSEGAVTSTPVLCGGLLHVRSDDGDRLEALDTRSGTTRWSVDISAYDGRFYHAGDSVLLVSGSGTVRALDGATGDQRWRRAIPGHTAPVFASYGDGRTAYATTSSGDGAHTLVSAVRTDTGELRRQRRQAGDLSPAGVTPDGDLLLTSTDREQRTDAVVRYNPSGGSERRIPMPVPAESTTAVVDGDTIHLLAYGGALLSVDTGPTGAGGKDLAGPRRLETSVSNASSPVVTGERLYFTAADGRLVSVDTRRGALTAQTPPRMKAGEQGYAASLPAPVTASDRVFAGAPDGTVFAVRAAAL